MFTRIELGLLNRLTILPQSPLIIPTIGKPILRTCFFPDRFWGPTSPVSLLPQRQGWSHKVLKNISTYIFLKGFLEGLGADLRVAGRSKVSKNVVFYVLLGSWAGSGQGPQMRPFTILIGELPPRSLKPVLTFFNQKLT